MCFYVSSFFKRKESFYKTNIYNIASSYDGTKLASPLVFYPEVQKLISNIISNKTLNNMVYSKLIEFYEIISSNSHMD